MPPGKVQRQSANPGHDGYETGEKDTDGLTNKQTQSNTEAVRADQQVERFAADDDSRIGEGEDRQNDIRDREIQELLEFVRRR